MTKKRTRQPRKLKIFRVGYYLEQGFAINVQARSEDDAERIVRERLDDECDKLEGSERVHYDDGIACADEVRS